MRRYKYRIATALAALAAIMLLASPVLAAYYADITVTESDGNSYDMLPVSASVDVDYLAANGFIETDGRDARVKTVGGADVPFMLVDDKVLFASPIDNDRQNAFLLSTDNSLIDNFSIVTGDGGYITTADHASLEPFDDFEIEFDGYIDTDTSSDLVKKTDAFSVSSDGGGKIIATIYMADDVDQLESTTTLSLYSGSYIRAGERVNNVQPSYITQLSFYLQRVANPTGTAYARVRRVSDDALVGTVGSIDVSTIDFLATWYDFTDSVYNPTQQDLRFTFEYDGGDAANNVRVKYTTGDVLGNSVFSKYQSSWDDVAEYDAAIKISFGDDITATASVTTGEHVIKVTGDGSDLKIYEDGVEEVSTSIVPVCNNDNDWIIKPVYLNCYKHTTSDTLRLTYEPDDIITGTTLPNELDAGTYDGVITYGSEPSGVSVAVGSLETTAISYPTDAGASQDIIQPTTAPLFDVNLERLEHNPLRPIVALIATEVNLTERLVWLGGGFFALFAALILVLWKSEGQITFTAFAGLGVCIIMYLLGIFPLWPSIVFGIGSVAAFVWERVVAL